MMRLVFSAILLLITTGCASVPQGSDRLAEQARTFVPPPGKANLYVVRPWGFVGSAAVWPVTLDFRDFGILGLRSYLYGPVSPGEHFLGSNLPTSTSNRAKFTAEVGKNYFFEISAGLLGLDFDPLEEADGRDRVKDYSLSGDSRFELPEEAPPPPR